MQAKALLILVCSLTIVSEKIVAQNLTGRAEMWNGKSREFTLGVAPEDNDDGPINIRVNEVNSASLNKIIKAGGEYTLKLNPDFELDIYGSQYKYSIQLKNGNQILTEPVLAVDANYTKGSAGGRKVYSVGQLRADLRGKGNINSLFFNPSIGREMDFEPFKNLKAISSQDKGVPYLGFIPENSSVAMDFTYPGDPFFWNDLAKADNLEIIQFNSTHAVSQWSSLTDIYCLDALDSDILLLPNLKSISLKGLTFFSVDFFSFEKLDHLKLVNMFTPELVNLALIMHYFGKDTSRGNWSEYLSEVDLSKKIEILENGSYKSYYKNGKPLCEGQFTNGLPDGSWKFWYEDGSLCQERFYKKGEPDGIWNFRVNEKHEYFPEQNIIHSFTYSNGRLINRKDYFYGSEWSNCDVDIGDDGEQVIIVSEYTLHWKTESEVNIKRTNYSLNITPKNITSGNLKFEIGDTLAGILEEWDFQSDCWIYNRKLLCTSGRTYSDCNLKGNPGQQAYYQYRKSIDNTGEFFLERIEVINLKDRYWEYSESISDSLGNLTPVSNKRVTIGPEDWPLNTF